MKWLKESGGARFVPEKYFRCLVSTVIFAAVVWVYLRATDGAFVFDDYQYVIENTRIHTGLGWPAVAWALKSTYASNWHPVTWVSHMLDIELYDLKPAGHHLTSVVLHGVNTVLLLIALSRLTKAFWRSAFVSALFGLHPLHVESVAWIAERKDVLSGFFWMIALIAYHSYAHRRGVSRYVLVLLIFVLGLASKPMVLTLPLVLILLDYWPLGRFGGSAAEPLQGTGRNRFRLLGEKIPLFILMAASAAVTLFAQASTGAVAGVRALPVGMRATNAAAAYVGYIKKTILPLDLAVYYPHRLGGISFWQYASSAALLGTVTLLTAVAARKKPYVIVGWLWYLIGLLPVIGIVQVGKQSMADRYTYIPLIGLFIIAGWGVPDLLRSLAPTWKGRTLVLAVAAAAVVTACAHITSHQISYWRDEQTLFGRALAVTRDNWMAHHGLARVLDQQGDLAGAVKHYRRSISIDPTNADVHNGLGTTLLKLGQTKRAIEQFQVALRLDPHNASAHLHYGVALQRMNRLSESEREFRTAVKLQPDNPLAHKNLAAVLARRGDFSGAIEHYRVASALVQDTDARCLIDLAEAYYRAGRTDDAVGTARRALRLVECQDNTWPNYIRSRLREYERR